MDPVILFATAVAAAALLYLAFPLMTRAFYRFRGRRIIVCPETHEPAGVRVDARHAAVTSLLGKTRLRLDDCTRWPERQGCGQECLEQVESAPHDCLVRVQLERWYHGKSCSVCGANVSDIHAIERKPGFIGPTGETLTWADVKVENLPEVMETHLPVCWTCHVAATFRRQFPDRVVDREVGGAGGDDPRDRLVH